MKGVKIQKLELGKPHGKIIKKKGREEASGCAKVGGGQQKKKPPSGSGVTQEMGKRRSRKKN